MAVGGWFYSLWDRGPPWVGGFACRGVVGFACCGSCVFRFGVFWVFSVMNQCLDLQILILNCCFSYLFAKFGSFSFVPVVQL